MAQASTAKKTTTSKSAAKTVSSESYNDSNVEKVTGTVKDTAPRVLDVIGKLFDRALGLIADYGLRSRFNR